MDETVCKGSLIQISSLLSTVGKWRAVTAVHAPSQYLDEGRGALASLCIYLSESFHSGSDGNITSKCVLRNSQK